MSRHTAQSDQDHLARQIRDVERRLHEAPAGQVFNHLLAERTALLAIAQRADRPQVAARTLTVRAGGVDDLDR